MTLTSYVRVMLAGYSLFAIILLAAIVCGPFMFVAAQWSKRDLTYRLITKPGERMLLWFVWKLPKRVAYWSALRVALANDRPYPLERPLVESLNDFEGRTSPRFFDRPTMSMVENRVATPVASRWDS